MFPDFWNMIVAETYIAGRITVEKSEEGEIPEPSESGLFVKSIGEPKGQLADWRTFKEGVESGVHAVEFRDRYELHVDSYNPYTSPVRHLLHDVGPVKLFIGAAALTVLKKMSR